MTNEENIDTSKYNIIEDEDVNIIDDDDFYITNKKSIDNDVDVEVDSYKKDTGVLIDFRDDTDMENVTPKNLQATNNTLSNPTTINDIPAEDIGYNKIDDETNFYDDTDEDIDDENFDDFTGLVDEDVLQENKNKTPISQGKVEKDYWEKIQRKHRVSNKKGTYNNHFHLSGDPKAEIDMFNNSVSKSVSPTSHNMTTSESSAIPSDTSMSTCCEAVTVNKYPQIFEDFCNAIGFEVFVNSDKTFTAIDKCDDTNEIHAKDDNDLLCQLRPYIDDCIIFPLQAETQQDYTDLTDWANWLATTKNSQFATEADYIDTILNHLNECFE